MTEMLRIRIPDELSARLDAEVEKMQKETPAAEVTRSSIVRYALEKFLDERQANK